jgi:hypothetical protein
MRSWREVCPSYYMSWSAVDESMSLGESIHSWLNLKLPDTTRKHESSTKRRFPGSPRNVMIVRGTADLTRLTHSHGWPWMTLGRALSSGFAFARIDSPWQSQPLGGCHHGRTSVYTWEVHSESCQRWPMLRCGFARYGANCVDR